MANKYEERLGTERMLPLIFKMALPAVAAQFVNLLYSMVDRIYIGHIPGIGTDALAGVGVTTSLVILISSFSAIVGGGGAPLAAIALGQGDRSRAGKILGNGFILLILFTLFTSLIAYTFMEPILLFTGASENTLEYAVLNNYGGLTGALDSLARINDPAVSDTPGVFASFLGPDVFNLFCVVVLTSLGTWGLPQMVQKFYAIKDERSIKTGTVVSTLFAIIVAGGCYFLGGFGRLTGTDVAVEGFDAIIPHLLEKLPAALMGLVVILVLSASMSTLSSLVLTSSSTLTIDFIKPVIAPKMGEKKQIFVMRIMLVMFVAVSAVIAIVQYSSKITFIAQLMGVSWGAIAGAFLAPFLYGLYWKKTTVAACWTCFVWGTGIMTLNFISNTWGLFKFPSVMQSPINCGAVAMVGGLIIVPIVSLFTKKPDQKKVEDAFSCYEETVTVAHRKALD